MTVVELWMEPYLRTQTVRVNRCLTAHITWYELVRHPGPFPDVFWTLLVEKLTPLIWLAMPVHDETHDEMVLANFIQWEVKPSNPRS